MNHTKSLTALAVIFAMTSGTAHAAAEFTFRDIDGDGNLEVSEREFDRLGRDVFAAWDRDRNRQVDRNELYTGIHGAWDSNRDAMIDENEYRAGSLAWMDEDAPDFGELDMDGDGLLDEDEFVGGFDEANLFDDWDTSDPEVFSATLYGVYDRSGDNMIDENEYGEFAQARMAGEATGAVPREPISADRVIRLADWRADDMYTGGVSVDRLFDNFEVYGLGGEEIGSIENVVFSRDGRVLSIVAEVGGFWDMFDTHVNVPWDQVSFRNGNLMIPVTEENVEDYSVFKTEYLMAADAQSGVRVVDDDLETGPQAFRATDLMGDYARIRDGDGYSNFGYVNDLIIRDGQLSAVVVSPDTAGYGITGPYAYPYYGYGWRENANYYDMPYDRDEAMEGMSVDYDRFDEG